MGARRLVIARSLIVSMSVVFWSTNSNTATAAAMASASSNEQRGTQKSSSKKKSGKTKSGKTKSDTSSSGQQSGGIETPAFAPVSAPASQPRVLPTVTGKPPAVPSKRPPPRQPPRPTIDPSKAGADLGTNAPVTAEHEQKAERTRMLDDARGRGFHIELMPAASICLPTRIVKCSGTTGKTQPFIGGSFTVGYRPIRELLVGLSYDGAAVGLKYSRPERPYDNYGHVHAVFGVFRVMLPAGRVDFGAEAGIGWSYISLPFTGGDKMFSHGLAMKFAPMIDVWLTSHVFLGVKADFVLNVHAKTCIKDGACIDRLDGQDEQAPFHVVLPGIHLGFHL